MIYKIGGIISIDVKYKQWMTRFKHCIFNDVKYKIINQWCASITILGYRFTCRQNINDLCFQTFSQLKPHCCPWHMKSNSSLYRMWQIVFVRWQRATKISIDRLDPGSLGVGDGKHYTKRGATLKFCGLVSLFGGKNLGQFRLNCLTSIAWLNSDVNCLTTPSHYLNQCLSIISEYLWHSH